jgi:aspartyl-tRNA(Asn)/glutamyl-tRNA(Gln) amidotransferase subunit C
MAGLIRDSRRDFPPVLLGFPRKKRAFDTMSLDPKQVKHIATLARIKVPDSDLPGLANELNGIMTWIEQLNEVKVDGVEPMAGVLSRDLPERKDVVSDGGDPEKVLKNAPDRAPIGAHAGFFVVPKVVE